MCAAKPAAGYLGTYCQGGQHALCTGLICGCSCHEPTKKCQDCGADMELVKASEGGRIEEPYFPTHPLRDQPLPRRSRPASFWACSGCENCEELPH